jgi:Mg2+/Co2+ transporter CorC
MADNKFRISVLPSAFAGVVSVKPNETVKAATTVMMTRDYSQLPVMTTNRSVKGVITWKSIGWATRLGDSPELVQDCMDKNVMILKHDDRILKAVRQIIEREFVLIRDAQERISGICTLADIGEMFAAHSEPFIEIEQIEIGIRQLIGDNLEGSALDHIDNVSSPGEQVTNVDEFTLGGYIRWLEDKSNWDRLGLDIDRKNMVEQLTIVNRIRNQLMHFRTDAIAPSDLAKLRNSSKFFRALSKLQRGSKNK